MTISPYAMGYTNYDIKPFIKLPKQKPEHHWLVPISNTLSDEELFFTESSGKVYRSVGQKIKTQPIINFSKKLTTNINRRFTAITLHPNFHLKDQTGSSTIYTAHIELFEPSDKQGQLTDSTIEGKHSHDTVITEWQLDDINSDHVKIVHYREVLRIAATKANYVSQLSFHPYLKPWSDDFGLLYISLNNNPDFKNSPLYSGSILRINPEKFGLLNYSIPQNNPFIKDPNLQDEIIVFGAENITQFTWSKKTNDRLIFTHKLNQETIISVTALDANFLNLPSDPSQDADTNVSLNKPLYIENKNDLTKNEITAKSFNLSAVYYKGKDLETLWNKILFISAKDSQWQLYALQISNNETTIQDPETIYAFNSDVFPSSNELTIFLAHDNELFIFDKTLSQIAKILPSTTTEKSESEQDSDQHSESSSGVSFYLFLLVIIIGISVFVIKNKYNQLFMKTKSALRTNFAYFEFSKVTNEISLFKRHEKHVHTTISVQDIICSEILLNDKTVNKVSELNTSAFTNKAENSLRISFEHEHRDKMIDDKVRKITLKLITNKNEEYLICTYLREGNQRLTKEKYETVIEKVIDWQWYTSSKINVAHVADRVVMAPPIKTSKPTTRVIKNSSQSSSKLDVILKQLEQPSQKTLTKSETEKVNTKLIDALNKLAILKDQGYLNEEEFEMAKNNLLKDSSNDS